MRVTSSRTYTRIRERFLPQSSVSRRTTAVQRNVNVHIPVDAGRVVQKTAMSSRTRLLLTEILPAFFGGPAWAAFNVLPAANTDLPKSQLKFSGD